MQEVDQRGFQKKNIKLLAGKPLIAYTIEAASRAANLAIEDIWKGVTFTKIRELHLSGKRSDLMPCDRCNLV